MKKIMFLVIALMLVSGCAPDPRKEAQAFEIRTAAEQDALNQAQAREQDALNQANERKQDAEKYAVELDELNIEKEHKEAIAAEWRNALNLTISIGKWFVIAGLCFVVFNASRSVSNSFGTLTEGVATAVVRKAEVRANLIRLDPVTRQYPVYLQYLGAGRFAAVNMNVNSVLLLDTRSDPDRQMISAMGAVQYAGALAQEAAKANDADSVALIQTPIVEAKNEVLTIGKDLWRNNE